MMPRIQTAHKFSERQRTDDVLTEELVEFKSLLLSSDVLKGLSSSGFERPSPIQLKAIPLGRCGLDLIAQAKSGTGKTCVFSVIALESLSIDNNATQVLILAPTREIAVQIKDVITAIGSHLDNLVCQVFIGGLPVEDDKKLLKKSCHIAVGTPGRIKFLIENHFLRTESVRLFILDEADKLLEDNFQEQINWIFSSLPSNKQMMAFSATYPEYLAKHLTQYMREPTFVRLNATDPTLQGIKQFYQLVPFHPLPHKTFQEKVTKLLKLLSSVQFHQCLVFSNYQIRAQSLCDTLRLKGWPSVFIAGSQTQAQRLKAMEKLKEFKCRVLISTDLTSRGIDAEHVNLVVNMDVPRDSETYLHRIGRAGRFGTKGIAVTFVAHGEEEKLFKTMEENIGITIDTLPDPIPQSLCTSEASNGLASRSVQSRTAVVEVDMLKNASVGVSQDKVHHDNHKSTSVQTSSGCTDEVLVDAGKMVCHGEQRSCVSDLMKQGCLENGSENTKTQTNLLPNVWIKSGLDMLPTNTETEKQVMAAIQNKPVHAEFSHCNQSLKESFNGPKELQKARDMTPLCRNQTDDVAAVTLQDAFEVDLQCGLMKRGDIETAEKRSSPRVSSTDLESSLSFIGEENDHIVNKLHRLKLDSHPDVRSINTRLNRYFLTDTSSGLQASAADKRKSSESLSGEESVQDDKSEHGDTTENEADSHSMSEEECNIIYQLPSVEEFERDFAEYLENVSNLVHFVEHSPNSSELEDEPEEDDAQTENELDASETKKESFNETSAADVLQSMPSHIQHYVSNNNTCERDHYDQLTQCQTDKHYSGHYGKSLSAVNSSHLYPNVHYNEWYGHDSTYGNHHHDYYYHYNYLCQGASTTDCFANGQRQPFPSSSLQYFGQSYIDHQDYLWKVSWYNSYQKQTNSIRQFVAFSRGGIRF